ncbi:hypothetical protein D3H64_01525 [Atopobacter sp. AH10]|uniref:hypothetical protein n=1 Tax=Atopobacter sp. AH10 TaxID=2315861 RepID=UPI000EF1EBCB|nr:hypothetical protein [Atopobacter sp. AH10]RLK64029.1 hypothetical protein D3H64_01525 [Atopobacter sp. AH10]
MSNSILDSVEAIENEAQRIEQEAASRVANLLSDHEGQVSGLKDSADSELSEFQDKLRSDKDIALDEVQVKLSKEGTSEKQRLTQVFDQRREELVELTIKEVIHRYGNSNDE